MIEGTTMSEGRGTLDSFLQFGDPSARVSRSTRRTLEQMFDVSLRAVTFVPEDIPGRASNTKHRGSTVRGWFVDPKTGDDFDPVAFGHVATKAFLDASHEARTNNFMFLLAGTNRITEYLNSDGLTSPASLWADEVAAFNTLRKPYLLY
jgi:uncharacterized protein YbbC (DUF1343 family)